MTLEFLGPLAVAPAGSRRPSTLVCAVLAAAGVAVLARPQPTTDYVGIGLLAIALIVTANTVGASRHAMSERVR